MSELVLVRHGQSGSFSGDPDGLTELGEKQAAALARHWLARGVRFDEAHSGTLRRQVQTERMGHEENVSKQDRRVEVKAPDRL